MFLCVNCGNNIQSSNKQLKISIRRYKIGGYIILNAIVVIKEMIITIL
jgi:hypothetical protein